MGTLNPFDGSVYITPDHAAGFGTAISDPAGTLAAMVSGGIYFQELPGEVDTVLINAGDKYLISMYKTLSNQRLMQQMVARSTTLGGQLKVRWVTRNLALSFDFQTALKSIGEPVTVSDDWTQLTAINQALASRFIQVFKAP